jgi:DNA-binding MarR family transcriptional regulator
MGKSRAERLKDDMADALRRHSGLTVLFHAAVAERLGLGPADHKCLDLLIRLRPMTAGELAERSGLTTGAITGVVDRLHKAGFAVRVADPSDRRRVVIEPVRDKVETSMGAVFAGIATDTRTMLAHYSADELELLLDFVQRAGELAERHTARLRQG